MVKIKYRRDGWKGRSFRRVREEIGRSREWVAMRTGVSLDTIRKYEADLVFPPHSWRDAAAVALGLVRADLGVPPETDGAK